MEQSFTVKYLYKEPDAPDAFSIPWRDWYRNTSNGGIAFIEASGLMMILQRESVQHVRVLRGPGAPGSAYSRSYPRLQVTLASRDVLIFEFGMRVNATEEEMAAIEAYCCPGGVDPGPPVPVIHPLRRVYPVGNFDKTTNGATQLFVNMNLPAQAVDGVYTLSGVVYVTISPSSGSASIKLDTFDCFVAVYGSGSTAVASVPSMIRPFVKLPLYNFTPPDNGKALLSQQSVGFSMPVKAGDAASITLALGATAGHTTDSLGGPIKWQLANTSSQLNSGTKYGFYLEFLETDLRLGTLDVVSAI